MLARLASSQVVQTAHVAAVHTAVAGVNSFLEEEEALATHKKAEEELAAEIEAEEERLHVIEEEQRQLNDRIAAKAKLAEEKLAEEELATEAERLRVTSHEEDERDDDASKSEDENDSETTPKKTPVLTKGKEKSLIVISDSEDSMPKKKVAESDAPVIAGREKVSSTAIRLQVHSTNTPIGSLRTVHSHQIEDTSTMRRASSIFGHQDIVCLLCQRQTVVFVRLSTGSSQQGKGEEKDKG